MGKIIDEIMEQNRQDKELIEIFESRFDGKTLNTRLSNLALKIASGINTDDDNLRRLTALVLLSIAVSMDAGPAQKIISRALSL